MKTSALASLSLTAPIARWVKVEQMSLTFDPKIPERIFRELLQHLLHAQTRVQFYLGDALNFAGKHMQGKYKRWLEESGYTYPSLANFDWVARAIPPERRRPELSFSYHLMVASQPEAEQDQLLKAAIKNKWSVRQLREAERSSGQPAKKTVFGDPINFKGLRHAPTNELGVVFLFALMSHDLGFSVESVHSAFPDCSAKRLVDKKRKRWIQVQIEFEYSSKNFLIHNHKHPGCDLIVCWEHNWPDCPLEVIALKGEMEKLTT